MTTAARLVLGGILALAMGLRLVPIWLAPSLNWADEIFQSTEQAHRLVYGTGLVPWEFQLGARSWLLPGALAGIMQLARLFGDGPRLYLPAIALALGALAGIPVACGFGWARRRFGLIGGAVAGLTVAIAPELVYFGARALSEVVAAHLLVGSVFLADSGRGTTARRALIWSGVVLGLAVMIRPQLAPGILPIGLWAIMPAWRSRLPPLMGGGVASLLAVAALDTVTLGAPFAALWRNVRYNAVDGVSATFGVESWSFYIRGEVGLWGGAFAALLLLMFLGARQKPILLLAAAAIVLFHSAIGHKEQRFIYPAILLGAILAGLGLAQLAAWGQAALRRRNFAATPARIMGGVVAIGIWAVLSWQVWEGSTLTNLRQRGHDALVAARFVAGMPSICGIGLQYGGAEDWVYGGYTHFHQPVRLYWPANRAELIAQAPAFDTLLSVSPPPEPLGYVRQACFGTVCVWQRGGTCQPMESKAMPFPPPVEHLRPALAASARAWQ